MDLQGLQDKIPTVSEIVESGEKVADKFEEKPTGSFVYILLVLLFLFTVYQHFDKKNLAKQLNECQKDNQYYARSSFDLLFENKSLKNTVKIQDTAIREANSYLKDSIRVYKLKPNMK